MTWNFVETWFKLEQLFDLENCQFFFNIIIFYKEILVCEGNVMLWFCCCCCLTHMQQAVHGHFYGDIVKFKMSNNISLSLNFSGTHSTKLHISLKFNHITDCFQFAMSRLILSLALQESGLQDLNLFKGHFKGLYIFK